MLCISSGHAGNLGSVQWFILACACIPLVRIVLKAMFEKQGGVFYMNANGGTENQL